MGVLVFTALTKQALPLIRYWTGDLASLSSEPCRCGRTFIRMSAIRGRTDDMLIIRGVNVFPTQVEEVLGRVPELTPALPARGQPRAGRWTRSRCARRRPTTSSASVGSELLSDEAIEADHTLRALRERVSGLIKDTHRLLDGGQRSSRRGSVPRSEGGKLSRVARQAGRGEA